MQHGDLLDRYNWRGQIKGSPNGMGVIRRYEIPLLSIARQATATALHAGTGGHPVFAVVGGTNTPPTVLRFTSGQAGTAITQTAIPTDYDPSEDAPETYAPGDHFKVLVAAAGSATPRTLTLVPRVTRVGGTGPTIADVANTVEGTAVNWYEFDMTGNELRANDIMGFQLVAGGTTASNIDVYAVLCEYRGLIVNADESNR